MPSAVHSELATEWATNLGLTTTELFHPIDQITLVEVLKRFWTGIRGADEGTLCSFSSRFLPSLVAAYKSMPAADGAYAVMLRRTMNDPYFVKFIRSNMGAGLFVFHAQQAINTNGWRTLVYLICPSQQVELTIERFAPVFAHRAATTYCGAFSLVNFNLTLLSARRLLSEQLSLDDALIELHEYIPWVMCAACWHDGDEVIMIKKRHRLSCGRCLATVYCCAEHQADDWHGTSSHSVVVRPPLKPNLQSSTDPRASRRLGSGRVGSFDILFYIKLRTSVVLSLSLKKIPAAVPVVANCVKVI
ncbi:hypothetical protein B0H11DRAFT_1927263 [Mycena galericulata]|nr:hypothetical protein B0H11DRAFT_1927263 [Mycena galericulata]